MKRLNDFKNFNVNETNNQEQKQKFEVGEYIKYKGGDNPEYWTYGKITKVKSDTPIKDGTNKVEYLYNVDGYHDSMDGIIHDGAKNNEVHEVVIKNHKDCEKKFNALKKEYKK